jgi:hypothetical protein
MLGKLLESVRKLMDTLAKWIANVLVVGWLWIPALYTVVFFLFLMMSGHSLIDYNQIWIVGLCVCIGASVLMIVLKGPRMPKSNKSTLLSKLDKPNLSPLTHPNNTNSTQSTTNNQYIVLQQPNNLQQQYQELPLVFASRVDANLFIHEYHDRLVFYRRQGQDMVYIGTEYKQHPTSGAIQAV